MWLNFDSLQVSESSQALVWKEKMVWCFFFFFSLTRDAVKTSKADPIPAACHYGRNLA